MTRKHCADLIAANTGLLGAALVWVGWRLLDPTPCCDGACDDCRQ